MAKQKTRRRAKDKTPDNLIKRLLLRPAQRPPCDDPADSRAWIESLAPCPFCRCVAGFEVPLVETRRYGLAHEACFVDHAPRDFDAANEPLDLMEGSLFAYFAKLNEGMEEPPEDLDD